MPNILEIRQDLGDRIANEGDVGVQCGGGTIMWKRSVEMTERMADLLVILGDRIASNTKEFKACCKNQLTVAQFGRGALGQGKAWKIELFFSTSCVTELTIKVKGFRV